MRSLTDLPSDVPSDGALTLYFAPLACSLASRIACYEADADIAYVEVDTKSKTLVGGGDFVAINPMGQVPVLEIGGRARLSENAAVLQFLVDRFPAAQLGPRDGFARARLQQWLSFIGTELHKAVFVPLLSSDADPAVRAFAERRAAPRLDVVERHLALQDHLLDRFSVADAYLATVLNWAPHVGVALERWPALRAYQQRITGRPQVQRALADELLLWRAGRERAAA